MGIDVDTLMRKLARVKDQTQTVKIAIVDDILGEINFVDITEFIDLNDGGWIESGTRPPSTVMIKVESSW